MAKLLHIFYHKEGTFSLLCQQVQDLQTHITGTGIELMGARQNLVIASASTLYTQTLITWKDSVRT